MAFTASRLFSLILGMRSRSIPDIASLSFTYSAVKPPGLSSIFDVTEVVLIGGGTSFFSFYSFSVVSAFFGALA